MGRVRSLAMGLVLLAAVAPAAYGQTRGGFDGNGHLLMHGTPRFVLGVYDSGGSYSSDPAFWENAIFSLSGPRGLQGFPLNLYLNYYLGGMPIGPTTALLDYIMDECDDALISETAQHQQQLKSWDPQGITFGATLAAGYREPSLWK